LEDVERLVLESDPEAVLANLAVTKIYLERAEADAPGKKRLLSRTD